MVKQQSFRYSYSSDLFKEDENTVDPLASATTTTTRTSQSDQLVDITNLPEPHKPPHAKPSEDPLGCEESMDLMDSLVAPEEETPASRCAAGRKR